MSDQEHDPTEGIVTQPPESPKYKPLTIYAPLGQQPGGLPLSPPGG